MKHPLHQSKEYPTITVLRDLASQENCDGEPYVQMIEASEQMEDAIQVIKDLMITCQVAGTRGYQLSRAQAVLDKITPLRPKPQAIEP